MTIRSENWVIFGVDLSKLARLLLLGWRQLLFDHSSWIANYFGPQKHIRLQSGWRLSSGNCLEPEEFPKPHGASPKDSPQFYFIALPSDQVLIKTLQLAEASEPFMDDAIELEVSASSPFSQEALIYGWQIADRSGDALSVLVAMTSKKVVTDALADWRRDKSLLALTYYPGVCAVESDKTLIELPSEGGRVCREYYLRKLKRCSINAGAATFLALLLIWIPAASSSFRAAGLVDSLSEIGEQSAGINQVIEQLHRQRSRLSEILRDVEERPKYAFWLNQISASAPDGTYLERLRINGMSVEVSGYSDNAANYLRLMTEQAQYTEVNARSAFVRDRRTGLERFTIDWVLIPEGE